MVAIGWKPRSVRGFFLVLGLILPYQLLSRIRNPCAREATADLQYWILVLQKLPHYGPDMGLTHCSGLKMLCCEHADGDDSIVLNYDVKTLAQGQSHAK